MIVKGQVIHLLLVDDIIRDYMLQYNNIKSLADEYKKLHPKSRIQILEVKSLKIYDVVYY